LIGDKKAHPLSLGSLGRDYIIAMGVTQEAFEKRCDRASTPGQSEGQEVDENKKHGNGHCPFPCFSGFLKKIATSGSSWR
jgi:hypothetical protein